MRTPEEIERGVERARAALLAGDGAVAAYLLGKTRMRPKRCAACGGRGHTTDVYERCPYCNPCCEEHFPSEAMDPEAQAEHVCPNCGWAANPDWLDAHVDDSHS